MVSEHGYSQMHQNNVVNGTTKPAPTSLKQLAFFFKEKRAMGL